MSQTLFGNPNEPVELGNPNTCAETKLCLILFYSAQEVVCYEPEAFIQLVGTKARIGSLKTLPHRQTEITVFNKNECIIKFTTDENSIQRFAKLQSEINTIT